MLILAIESSCDDTGAAVLENNIVLASALANQDVIHARYGGVVPELASRRHIQSIHPVVSGALDQAGVRLEEIDLIAATQGPGLIGSLLVGFCYAKALSYVLNIPIIGVDHMAGHILSVHLEHNSVQFPYIALIVSGGTSSLFRVDGFTRFHHLGRTRDDAAGEAFDKVAKLLKLPYPGGPHIAQLASKGDPEAINFPRAWLGEDSLDFSFSGLKTAVLNHVRELDQDLSEQTTHNICASFEQAVIDVLVEKTIRAAEQENCPTVTIGGGVAANTRLREQMSEKCQKSNLHFFSPSPLYCTDNAAMIGLAAYHRYRQNHIGITWADDVYSRSQLG